MRLVAAAWVLAELAVFVLVAAWIGVGWTILATLATSALGFALLARQGTRALTELRDRARERRPAGRALGDAGLVAVGGLLMVLPGFLGDLVGLLCLLPGTRALPRFLIGRVVTGRLPEGMHGPVHVRSSRVEQMKDPQDVPAGGGWQPVRVIEGEVVEPGPPRP
jgi:UPF0716 protein FxsA